MSDHDSQRSAAPYHQGMKLTIQFHTPPPPFGDRYDNAKIRKEVYEPETFDDAKRLNFVLAHPPLETPPPTKPRTRKLTIRESLDNHKATEGGPYVVRCSLDSDHRAYVAKIYDGAGYPLWSDCTYLADEDYAVEATAYQIMPHHLQGSVVPRYFGSWTFPLSVPGRPSCRRWVRMILLEMVEGKAVLDIILRAQGYASRSEFRAIIESEGRPPFRPVNYSLLPPESERLDVLAGALEAEVRIFAEAAISHEDLSPRNILVTPDGCVMLVDFNAARLCKYTWDGRKFFNSQGPDALPISPIERYWRFPFCTSTEFHDWIPQSWLADKAPRLELIWLCERWGDRKDYAPLDRYFIEQNVRFLVRYGLLPRLTAGLEIKEGEEGEEEEE